MQLQFQHSLALHKISHYITKLHFNRKSYEGGASSAGEVDAAENASVPNKPDI